MDGSNASARTVIVQPPLGDDANVQDVYALTPLQEGMLFHHVLGKQDDAYVASILLELQDRSSADAFIDALQRVIQRHDILRSAVHWQDLPQPVQVVYRHVTLPVEYLQPDRDRTPIAQLQGWMKAGRGRMNLRRAPLIRLRIVPDVQSERLYALLQIHHVICDGQSLQVVIAEVMAHVKGLSATLPEQLPYRQHVAQTLAHAKAHDASAFFRRKLGDIEEPTAPYALLDVRGTESCIEEARQALDADLCQRLRAVARKVHVSAAMLFHAAWAVVVARTSQSADAVFGTVLFGRLRTSHETKQKVGMFLNTLPLRLRLHGVTAHELVDQARRELVELLGYEQASLALAQRCSGIGGSAPLFSTLLNYRYKGRSPAAQGEDADPGFRVLATHSRTNYPITLSVEDDGDTFAVLAQTDERIDPHRIVGYMAKATESLVEALETAPWLPALALPILPEAEHRQVLEQFNATAAEYPQERLIHELIEEQVERTPDAVALLFEGQSLTYAELNGRANQLARYLRKRGVGPDERVALCLERSAELVIGMLGILKAGGAYVPLDPAFPADRLSYMIEDAAPRVLLTPDFDWSEIAGEDATNLPAQSAALTSRSLAYVIYTSGSTGLPKGVMLEHTGVVNFLLSMQKQPGICATDCLLAVTTVSFDIAGLEIYLPLICGAKVVLVSHEVAQNPHRLIDMMERFNVTMLQATPATWRLLIGSGWTGRANLKALCGGEALSTMLSSELISRVDSLWNVYGPTETTIWSCCRQVTAVTEDSGAVESIGRPIDNTSVYILDRLLQPVPMGVAGEIHIGGAGVARGYLNRAELTEQRFIADPFSSVPQARMYKTGDLGCWNTDGTLQYLGRNDHQVKIRGYRVEVGEIEAQLTRHPQVKEAVVIAREDASGEKRLVAYVVGDPVFAQLREHLKAQLPDYMVPAAWVALERLPLTPNGKVDRRALPDPDNRVEERGDYVAPRTELESKLADIWAQLLQVERVGAHDNFFELGGHSLLVVQMMERLHRIGLTAEIQSVFENPTLAELAMLLKSTTAERVEAPLNLIPPGCESITPEMLPLAKLLPEHIDRIVQTVPGGAANVQDIYPLTRLQEGILFHHLLNEKGGGAYILTILLSLSSRPRLDEFVAALQAVIDRHDVLRTAVLWEQLPGAVQVVYRRAALPVQELVLEPGVDALEQMKERMRPEHLSMDLRRASLARLQVAEHSTSGQCYALLELHHIVGDRTSLKILTSEVVAYLQGQEQELPPPLPYRMHVAQELAYARTHNADEFFRQRLQGIDEPTLPFGLVNVHGDGTQIAEGREELSPAFAKSVRVQARRHGVSAATLFHAAWALVVAGTSGRDDIVFGSVLLGRLHGSAGAQRILGMFINTLPLRLDLKGVTAKELIEHTQRELAELLNHEHTSLAEAQRCSGLAGHAPLFSALLNYLQRDRDAAEWDRASGLQVVARQWRTNYPITFSVDDDGDGFVLTAQTDERIDPQRLVGYMSKAAESLVEALEKAPWTPALALEVLPEHERRQILEEVHRSRLNRLAPAAPGTREAPQGEIETTLARIWTELLKVETVYRDDNFFERGGHSLLGVKLIARIAETLRIQPPTVSIFRYPTIRQMAQLVASLVPNEASAAEWGDVELEEGAV